MESLFSGMLIVTIPIYQFYDFGEKYDV